jgi:hypothetical protein
MACKRRVSEQDPRNRHQICLERTRIRMRRGSKRPARDRTHTKWPGRPLPYVLRTPRAWGLERCSRRPLICENGASREAAYLAASQGLSGRERGKQTPHVPSIVRSGRSLASRVSVLFSR